jgi:hypothetical protein
MFALPRPNEDALSSGSEAALGLVLLASSMVMLFIIFVSY